MRKGAIEKVLNAVGSGADPDAVRYAMLNGISLNDALIALQKPMVLEGTLIPDPKHWDDYVRVGPTHVKNWIWDALKKMPEGRNVRITVEVVREPTGDGLGPYG
jgi:hypothetical protein